MQATTLTHFLKFNQINKDDYTTSDIEEVKKLLSTKSNYYFKYDANNEYTLYIDIDDKQTDDFTIDDFIEFLSNYLNQIFGFEIEEDDVKYTKNYSKEVSYHISVPKIKSDVKTFLNLVKTINKDTKFKLDESIYTHQYFRCPNQYKENKQGTEHLILKGNIEDFIITNLSNAIYTLPTVKIDNKPSELIKKNTNQDDTIVLICKLTDMLSKEYYDNYDNWSRVAFILKNYEYHYKEDLSELFHLFSKKSSKYNYNSVESFYNNIKPTDKNKLTIGSLCLYAKESNIQLYKDVMRQYYDKIKFEINEKFLAKTLFDIGGHKYFIYKNGVLYTYSKMINRWFKNGIDIIKNFINDDLRDYVNGLINDCVNEESIKKEMLKVLKSYTTINKNKNALIEEYQNRYARLSNDDVNFDDQPFLVGFNNGLYDIKNDCFREYNYTDYITVTTGYDYRKPDINKSKIVIDLLNKIETEEEKRYLLLQLLSSGLINKSYQKFIVFNGSGANGKSLLNKFLNKTLGNFFYKGNNDTITNSKLKIGANPEIANMHLKRYVCYSEPSENSTICNATIKSLTGDATINARQLFSSETETKLRSNIYVECNKRLAFESEPTFADIRRYIDYEFTSKFTLNDKELNDDLKIYKGTEFDDQMIDDHKIEFLHILIRSAVDFINIDKEVYRIPQSVEDRTKSYIENSYIPYVFLNDNYIKTGNSSDVIAISDIYDNFKTSEIYLNMTKEERKKFLLKDFCKTFENHMATKNFYKERLRERVNGKQIEKRNVLIGYKINDDIQQINNFEF